MKLRTEIADRKAERSIGYDKPILMLGSCFTDNIGAKFKKYLFHVLVNPFGVTYNPFSILSGIQKLVDKEKYVTADLHEYNELFFSFDHYTKYSNPVSELALSGINKDFLAAKEILPKAGTLILTFGSAYIFTLKESGEIANNCHKLPDSKFTRRMISVKEIVENYSVLLEKLLAHNPSLNILFTVSPVRHIKDGLVENQRSKSTLLLSIQELEKKFPKNCSYFPAYEIMIDDLRDYRWYTSDLLHPNEQAIDYIWEYFILNMMDATSNNIIKQINPLLQALAHRPIHPETAAAKKFLSETKEMARKLQETYPHLFWPEKE